MNAWNDVAGVDELADGERKEVELPDGAQVCVVRHGDEYYAIGAWCSHDKAAMALGVVRGTEIRCPLHGARFDLRTGKNLSLPAVRPIPVFEVKVEAGRIWVKSQDGL